MEYVKIAMLDNAFEAHLIEAVLTERDIPHIIRSYHDDAYGNLFQTTKGWGAVQAPESYRQEIVDIIQDIRNSSQEIGDTEYWQQ